MPMPARSPRRPPLLAFVASALLVLAASVANATAASAASAAGACVGNTGVTVVVDATNAGGGISVRCALGPQASGWKALESAGHVLTSPPRYPGTAVCQIDGLPQAGYPTCWESNVWWYSHASSPDASSWSESGVGAATYAPAPGTVEGWKYRSLSDPNRFPPPGPGFGIGVPPVASPPTPPATKPPSPGAAKPGGSPVAPSGGVTPSTLPTAPTTTAPTSSGLTATTAGGLIANNDATTTGRPTGRSTSTSSDKRALAGADLSNTRDSGGIPIGTIVGAVVVLALAAAAAVVAYRRARAA
jgi:hypothetical protein